MDEIEAAIAAVQADLPTHDAQGNILHPLDVPDPVFNSEEFLQLVADGTDGEEAYVIVARQKGYQF